MPQNNQPWWAQSNQGQTIPSNMNNYGFPGTAQNRPRPSFVLYGRMVEREEDIRVSDVPMDGTPGFFPLADWSAVIVKAWSNDGQIRAMRYVAEDFRAPSVPIQEPVQQVAPTPQSQPQQQPSLTAEQVGQMIDAKLGQLVTALMANNQQQQPQAQTVAVQQPPKQQNKPKKEEAQQ